MKDPCLVSRGSPPAAAQAPLAYSIPEAVTISGIGRTLLYAEIAAGRLLAVKAGRRTLIPRTALEQFISRLPSATANGFIRLTNKTV
jgi:excisionase family DNA binding protein